MHEESNVIDYRPDLLAQTQRILDGELPAVRSSPLLSVTVERGRRSQPNRLTLRSSAGWQDLPINALEAISFGDYSWQVDIEALTLPPLDDVVSISVLECFPTLRSQIESFEVDPLPKIEALNDDAAHLRALALFWSHTYETPQGSRYGRIQSNAFKINVISIEETNSGDYSSHEIVAGRSIDYLQSIAINYPAIYPHISRGLTICEIDKFLEIADKFNSRLKIYMYFSKEIDSIYRNAFRSNLDGAADLTKVESEISKFLRREAVVSSYMEKWEREVIAEDVAWIASRFIGQRPSKTETNGILFEEAVATELERCGYLVDRTPITGDFGADLVVEKDDLRYAIQCKSHAKPIGIKAVQEAVGARRYYKCDFGVVIASTPFTAAAKELAQETGVILIAHSSIDRLEAMSI